VGIIDRSQDHAKRKMLYFELTVRLYYFQSTLSRTLGERPQDDNPRFPKKGGSKNPIRGVFGAESTVLQDVPPEPSIACAYNRLYTALPAPYENLYFQGTLNESLTRIPGLQSVDFSLLIVAIIHYCLRSTSQTGGI